MYVAIKTHLRGVKFRAVTCPSPQERIRAIPIWENIPTQMTLFLQENQRGRVTRVCLCMKNEFLGIIKAGPLSVSLEHDLPQMMTNVDTVAQDSWQIVALLQVSYSCVFLAAVLDLPRLELALGRPAACISHVFFQHCQCAHCDSNVNVRRKNTQVQALYLQIKKGKFTFLSEIL